MMDIQLPSNRKFGLFFSVIFIGGALYLFSRQSSFAVYFAGLGGLFFFVTLVKADALLPLNRLWMRFGLLLGMIISPIVLAIIFFGLFTPIGLVTRLFGRDELRLKRIARASHWKYRAHDTLSAESFRQQF